VGKKNKAKRHDDARQVGADGTREGAKIGGSLPKLDRDIMLTVAAYLEQATALASQDRPTEITALGKIVESHLGVPPTGVPLAVEQFGDHRLVDADRALRELLGEGRLIGVSGGEQRQHQAFPDLLNAGAWAAFGEGPVDYAFRATGPESTEQVVTFGVWLLEFDGVPLAALLRGAAPQYGRGQAQLEILCAETAVASGFQARLKQLMIELSVLRGQVLSFQRSEYGGAAGATFVERPRVWAEDVVLPDGVLEGVSRHVVGIAEHREELLEAGQHLKRGVLLYGPPGTGKTLTVRHLLSVTEGTTAVLLTGSTIALITEAAELARTFQPSIVVMEDIDLVAMQRGHSPQPLLFEVLDALDGLDGDADVAFLMTTNRVNVLERALAQRPGRVDLAVEIGLPALTERRRLFGAYARDLNFTAAALDQAAEEAAGTTGSFAKELMRRAVLLAAERRERLGDDHLDAALASLLDANATLTRRLLGADPRPEDGEVFDQDSGEDFGFVTGGAGPEPRLGGVGTDQRVFHVASAAYSSEVTFEALEGDDMEWGAVAGGAGPDETGAGAD
jgi:DNA polymerase III delta prime subunit